MRSKFLLSDYRDILPADWARVVEDCVRTRGVRIDKIGVDPGHLKRGGETKLVVRCASTTIILERCPFVEPLFMTIAEEIRAAFGQKVRPLFDSELGININMIEGPGAAYELHNDVVGPFTTVLFATTHTNGGGLHLYADGHPGPSSQVQPIRGCAVHFSNPLPHEVSAIQGTADVYRIVVTCSYVPPHVTGAEREAALPGYLDFLFNHAPLAATAQL